MVEETRDGFEVENDSTLDLLAHTAVSLARAGADIVAPSDMMDGRVAAIRRLLDDLGFAQTPILSYASKFASAFYGPFREAADSAPQFGDRKTYQMDGANLREAMREIDLDLEEGADMILMKPAMPYLDVIRAARERVDVPIGAYQVSGEYSMLQAAFQKRLARPRPRHARIAGQHPPRGRGLHRDLLCEGSRQTPRLSAFPARHLSASTCEGEGGLAPIEGLSISG